MKIRKIIYIVQTSFIGRDFERFGIKIMKDNGFNVEVWDLTPLIEHRGNESSRVTNYQGIAVKVFFKKRYVKEEINNLKLDTMVISTFGFDHKILFLFRELSKLGILYSVLYANTIPSYIEVESGKRLLSKERITYFIRKIRDLNIYKLKKQILTRIPISWLMIKPPDYILAGGSQTLVNYNPPIGKGTEIIWIHALDYDLYLEDLKKPSINEFSDKKYAIFIDGYWPFYPDYIRMNVKPPVTPDNYYPLLCDFFSSVERETGFDVIIAAHPRSKYEEHPDYFKGRKTIHGRTKELIRDSKLVLMHYSTSLNFAVLYKKPVIFFTTNEMEQFNMDANYIRGYSSELNKSFININDNYKINWEIELKIDEKSYSDYREKYIKRKNTKDKFFWQIVADEIKKV